MLDLYTVFSNVFFNTEVNRMSMELTVMESIPGRSSQWKVLIVPNLNDFRKFIRLQS